MAVTGTPAFMGICTNQFSGIARASAKDTVATGTSTATTYTTGSFTTSVANELLLAFCDSDDSSSTLTAGTGYTMNADHVVGLQYQLVASTLPSVTASFTSTSSLSNGIILATFKAMSY
jgi:hypothetical protein